MLLSQATRELIAEDVRDLGLHRLKDLSSPVRLYQLGGSDFPPLRTLSQTNLPLQSTPFLGRERELAALLDLVGSNVSRLLTLTGPGGTGKTRLAVEAAKQLVEDYEHGVWWVPLAALEDPALVVETAAKALGANESLAAHIGDRRLLLVLDNFEHVLGAAPEVAALLAACPNLRVLATSREPLRLSAEQEYPVPSLARPEAVDFFLARARTVSPGFELDDAVGELCRRLDDLPLALELAAARVKMLSTRQILDRLEQRLTLLTGGARDLPERQRTLRGAISWSHELLDDGEKALLRRLAVFAGGWTLVAAEAVCEADVDTLGSLVEKSLVRVDEERYAFLEAIRDFTAERLSESGESEDVHRRHAVYYLELAEEVEPKLFGFDQAGSLDLLEVEHDNLRRALAWLGEQPERESELRLAVALGRFRYVRGYLVEGQESIERALARSGDDDSVELRAKALRGAAALAVMRGEYAEAKELTERGLELSRLAGDTGGIVRSLSNLGAILHGLGETEAAAEALEEAVSLARASGDMRSAALALNNLGDVVMSTGDHSRAAVLFDESLTLLRPLGDSANVARSLYNAAVAAIEMRQADVAAERLRESLPLSLEIGDWEDVIWCLIAFAALAARSGKSEHAACLLAAADAGLSAIGGSMKPFERSLYARTLSDVRNHLSDESFAAAQLAGGCLTLQAAAEAALSHA